MGPGSDQGRDTLDPASRENWKAFSLYEKGLSFLASDITC